MRRLHAAAVALALGALPLPAGLIGHSAPAAAAHAVPVPAQAVTTARPGHRHLGQGLDHRRPGRRQHRRGLPHSREGAGGHRHKPGARHTPGPTQLARPGRSVHKKHRHHRRHPARRARAATAAADPADSISDFKFTPASSTVHVGDTVTWTNNGPSVHTATANDGSFDTGQLKRGQSGSHTFTRAGTFAYICQIHPFMHGTIVVLANATTPAPAGTAATPKGAGTTPSAGAANSGATSGSGGASTANGQTLPNTGIDLTGTLVLAVVLAAGGLALRRALTLR